MSSHPAFSKTTIALYMLPAVFGVILAQSASAKDLHGKHNHSSYAGGGSMIRLSAAGGTTISGVSVWHADHAECATERMAPKAKIIDVQAAVSNPACLWQNGVCVIRLHSGGTL